MAESIHRARTSAKSAPPPESTARPYFTPEALKFLRGLKRRNDREWFEPRKPLYEREIKQPMLALVTAVTHAMEDFAPHHVRPAHKSIMRIYRDTRFSADKSPYKTNVAAWWTRSGLEKTSGGGYYLHITAEEVVIAAGVYMPGPAQLLAIRNYLVEHHEEVRRLLNDKKLLAKMNAFEGPALSHPPKGFAKDGPAVDLLKCRQWGVSATLPASVATQPTLVKEVVARFRLAAALVEALNTPLVAASNDAKPKPLFGLY